ncbi:AAA family ATPase [Streptomyces sp. NPDC088387]|uniref:helix-turn-helix transcriptional regulator n=1 Tax=Streptomyces sp. NPDC088387 TaxID=3365859 RepID=UPI0037F4A24B
MPGREAEVRAVESALRRTGGTAPLLVLHGEPGIGKTVVLEAALRAPIGEGLLTTRLTPAADEALGLHAAADAVCDLLTAASDDVSGRAAALRRAQSALDRQGPLPLLQEVQIAVRHLSSHRPVAVVLDDAHLVADDAVGVFRALLRGFCADGVPVLVAGRMPEHRPGPVRTLAEIADRVIGLAPLAPAETGSLLGRYLSLPAEPGLVAAVHLALGTLAGNPGAVLSVIGALREDGRLRTVDGMVCLLDPGTPLRLSLGPDGSAWFPWLRPASPPERDRPGAFELAVLLARLTASAELRVDDLAVLAPALGHSLDAVGRALDLLAEHGVVTVGPGQRLAFGVPALGTALRDAPSPYDIPALHAHLVRGAVERAGGATGWLDPRLCDHALAAGPALAADLLDEVLLAVAGRDTAGDGKATTRACVAVLRRLPHGDARVPELLPTAVDLMLRQGDTAGLLELGNQLLPRVAGDGPEDAVLLDTLAPAWAFAALHEHWLSIEPDGASRTPAVPVARRVPAAAALLDIPPRLIGADTPPPTPPGQTTPTPPGPSTPTAPGPMPPTAAGPPMPTVPRPMPPTAPEPPIPTAPRPTPPTAAEPPIPTAPRPTPPTTAEPTAHTAPRPMPPTTAEPTAHTAPEPTDSAPAGPVPPTPAPTAHPAPPTPHSPPAAPRSDGRHHTPDRQHGRSPTPLRFPLAAESRLVACAAGTGVEFDAALREVRAVRSAHGLEPLADPDKLREAVAYGDWATASEVLLGDRYTAPEDSPSQLYQALIQEYLTGSWQTALSLARQIELRPQTNGRSCVRNLGRSLAAEICRWNGDLERATEWLDRIPGSAADCPWVSWARCGLRHDSGNRELAWDEAWRDYRRLRGSGRLVGLERLLLRLVTYATLDGHRDAALEILRELDELNALVGSRQTREVALLARGGVHRDIRSGTAAHALISQRGDQYLLFRTCEWLARITDAPEQWLRAAGDLASRLSSPRARRQVTETAQLLGSPLPRRRAESPLLSPLELSVVDMVSTGATNRQIATALTRSEKSVETYLSKIFERTGCRSRLALATAWLDGSLAWLVPDRPDSGD